MTTLMELNTKRGVLKGRLTRLETFLNEFDHSKQSISLLNARLQKFEEAWVEFDDLQTQIELLSEEKEIEDEYRGVFEEKYFDLKAKIADLLNSNTDNQSLNECELNETESPVHIESIKLPKISLPKFSGEYDEWLDFHDVYVDMIHNSTTLSNIQKFYYLRSCLSKEALRTIKEIKITAENYDSAWELIKKRFHHKRLIINTHVQAILNLKRIDKPTASNLRQVYDVCTNRLTALRNLGEPTKHWGTLLENLLINKLDSDTKDRWEIFTVKNDTALSKKTHIDSTSELDATGSEDTFDTFMTFLDEQCRLFEAREKNGYQPKPKIKVPERRANSYSTTLQRCKMCGAEHTLSNCKAFTNLPMKQRHLKAREMQLCLNCLRTGHRTIECKSPYTCKTCKKKHHTLLHFEANQPESQIINKQLKPEISTIANHTATHNEVILATAIINISDSNGKLYECRALLDSGSQSHFIKHSLATALGLKFVRSPTSICGINQKTGIARFSVQATIHSRLNNFKQDLNFIILKKITNNLPISTLNEDIFIPEGIRLADEKYYLSRGIDILLGASIFFDLLLSGQIRSNVETCLFQNTLLGWVVSGCIPMSSNSNQVCYTQTSTLQNQEPCLEELITSFWKLEEMPAAAPQSQEDITCEEHYIKTIKRQKDGRYVVKYPFSQPPESALGFSNHTARTRFFSLEKRLDKDPTLKTAYTDVLNEYLEKDEMEIIPDDVKDNGTYYLPHHPVLKESSSTTKLRVVFDASAKTSSGKSLNDILYVGPTLQRDLISILLSFRTYTYVFTADVKQMYRQILIDDTQWDFQRVLWRSHPNEDVQQYRLKTVTFGVASAPYLAIRTLMQLAKDEEANFPEAAICLRRDFYVDDVLTGGDDLGKVIELQSQLIKLLAAGRFELRKWCANNPMLIKQLPPEHVEANLSLEATEKTIKTLGIQWQPKNDTFNFNVNLEDTPELITKRFILSDISRLFDPVGLISPVIITAKMFMQEIWCLKGLTWDDSVPEPIKKRWIQYRNQLKTLNDLSINRRVVVGEPFHREVQIHGFCDASIKAYGAAIYVRTVEDNGEISVNLLCSKSRIAPLKTLSLPRLELCGALLLARLYEKCQSSLNQLNIKNITFWTDSTIVLHWLNSESNTWQIFVSNRVSQIQTLTANYSWKHVRSHHNPADLISRSISPNAIIDCKLWWNGPEWLMKNENQWPDTVWTTTFDPELEERKRVVNFAVQQKQCDIDEMYSSWNKLIRVAALCRRFIFNCKNPQGRNIEPLDTTDYNRAELGLIKHLQGTYFREDLKAILKNKRVSNQIKALSPFIDSEGILRVGGRLKNANIDPDHKNQILLPNHHITHLIIENVHKQTCHSGPQLLLATVRTKYWPLNGKMIARSTVRRCIKCSRANPRPFKHLMGDLPPYRVQSAPPFSHCGIDYGGPLYFKRVCQKRSTPVKAYLALFICMVTKAIHLELVPDLTTVGFLNALQRMQARRGGIKHIYSDNATNFVGANNQLKELKQLFESEAHQDQLQRYCASKGIKWSFIPPRSPHFGGLWESGIKMVKGHLKRVIGRQILTYDELETFLILIEGCVNSRPLTISSENPDDLNPLTPAHFLVGRPLSSLPVPDLTNVNTNHLNRWQLVQQLHQSFWKRWKNEYLSTLQKRVKWTEDQPEPKIGTIVLIKEESRAPLHWDLGRIVNVHPGADGRIRVATVKTSNGEVKRCIAKLCPILND